MYRYARARSAVHAALARVTLAAGAELHATGGSGGRGARGRERRLRRWWTSREVEAPLWSSLAALWALPSGSAAVAATTAWGEMDAWEEAGCGTVPALYALLLAQPPAATSSSAGSPLAGFAGVGKGVMRAAYALLSTPELMKPAVLGLDANISDVDLVLEAMAKAEEDGGEDEGDDDDEDEGEGGAVQVEFS
jgi:hypothetical protein